MTDDLGTGHVYWNRVYVMYDGRILENADCNELFQKPTHQYTKDLLKTRPAANPPGKPLPVIKRDYPL